MSPFQLYAVALTAIWLAAVAIRFRTSRVVLTGGLFVIGLAVAMAVLLHRAMLSDFGLALPHGWLPTLGFAVGWLVLMLAYSPLADRIATRFFAKPPTLGAFRALQQSRLKLAVGIVIAWILGGFLEELVFRGVVLRAIEVQLAPLLTAPGASAVAILVAAAGAGVIHLYQGPRAVIVIVQLSALFGLLFVVSGHNLWSVILCHGLYDTVAFIRFASGKSRYSKFADQPAPPDA
jgi:membrane protease YdiL (CAAX protease family)